MYIAARFHKLFRNMHPNGNALPAFVGSGVMLGMLLFKPQLYKEQKRKYNNYCEQMADSEKRRVPWSVYVGCRMIYGTDLADFYCYDYPNLSDAERRTFVTDIGRQDYYEAFNHSRAGQELFANKYLTYMRYRPYYQRDIIMYRGEESLDDLAVFLTSHPRFMIKPLNKYMGKGIAVLDSRGEKEETLQRIKDASPCVLEELIIQSSTMKKLHPGSVNTVRVPTFRGKDGIQLVMPFLRVGVGDSVVDNAGAGGILVAVDPETGITISAGRNELGYVFDNHPDTCQPLYGIQLPDWENLKRIIGKLMMIEPDTRYVGWDLAHTDNGWVVVEGNDVGQFVGQIPLGKGCKEIVDQILTEIQ